MAGLLFKPFNEMWYLSDPPSSPPSDNNNNNILPTQELNRHFLVRNALPTQDLFAKLVPEAVEQYQAVLELIENHPRWPQELGHRDPNYRHILRGQTKAWFLHWMEMIQLEGEGFPKQAKQIHAEWKRARKKKRSAYRQHIKQKNTHWRKEAATMCIWLPKESEWPQWRETLSPSLYQRFHTLVKSFRAYLGRERRGLLQYIPKKGITPQTRVTLITNLYRIRHYLSSSS